MRPRLNVRPVLMTAFAGVVAIAIAKDFVRKDSAGIDFHTYVAAAIVGMRDGWAQIYDQGLVAAAQRTLDSHVWAQPFLSTPPVAILTSPLALIPYPAAYLGWGALTLAAFAAALAWSSPDGGAMRWIAVGAAIVPWWVVHAIHVGQVAPLVAASMVVAWRLLREDRDVAAGLVLGLLLLKPNTAFLVPVALVLTARWRALAAWLGVAFAVGLGCIVLIGGDGATAYVSLITHVPADALRGATLLTIGAALPVSSTAALVLRLVIAGIAGAAMYRYRAQAGMAIAVAGVGSLLVATYLHASDLCVLTAAGWIVWHERAEPAWRALIAGVWLLATPYLDGTALAPALDRWVVCELVVFGAFAFDALARPALARRRGSLTGWAASRSQAPA